MSLDPLRTSQRITDSYRNYLRSSFSPREDALARSFESALAQEFRLTRGPYLQADAPFVTGASVTDLIDEGVLHPDLRRLSGAFPVERPLYAHQEEAIRRAVGGNRNLVVATGTGSGKTECFLLPIFDALLREQAAGTLDRPGVRALLLYPMNALANDQVKRLRRLLAAMPEITFGRYVGETRQSQAEGEEDFRARNPREELQPNELISRERMRDAPPHILLTNYAMLEYLLLRPEDSSLFDGPTGEHWRFLVLDEAHVYNGAQGTEVAMLLRRVRDRVLDSQSGVLRCFATSATLGAGAEDHPALVEFARSLFAESFEWDPSDPERQDVVVATRKELIREGAVHELSPACYLDLQASFRADGTSVDLAAVIAGDGGSPPAPAPDQDPGEFLFEVLSRDKNVVALQAELEQGSVELDDIARRIFRGPDAARVTVALIDLCVAAKSRDEDAPLIPARYHFFLRSLEGAFICLHPSHSSGEPQLRLQRAERCPSCVRQGREAAMFELGVCRNCGAGYLVGDHVGDESTPILKTAGDYLPGREYYVLSDALDPEESDDEDGAATGVATARGVNTKHLCPSCGMVSPEAGACACTDRPRAIAVGHVDLPDDDPILHSCVICASRTSGEVVTRFVTGTDAPVSVIATDLYQQLPPSRDPAQADLVGAGRKLLTFSDSRQDAAFFAPYLERTYQRAVQRRLIAGAIVKLTSDDEAPRFEDIAAEVRKRAEDCLVLDPDQSRLTNNREVNAWLVEELLAIDRRQSIEGTGTAEIAIALPRRYEPPKPLLDLGLEPQEVTDLFHLLFETVRSGGAITMPDGVDIRDARFEPRNFEFGVRESGGGRGVVAWLPTRLNRRLEIVSKVLAAKGIDADPTELLRKIWRHVTDPSGVWAPALEAITAKQGALWRLAHERFEFLAVADEHRPLRCGDCHRIWWRSVGGICPTWRCQGTVAPIEDLDGLQSDHYARLYGSLDPIGMAVQEHTAQWNAATASNIQDEFVDGRVNVLSCSTTFELGVDVGEVEAVMLRNVPPRPANYVQRAGRAGRRTDSAALVVTFAQRRNHDLSHFGDPRRMVDGTIAPPIILLDNPSIVRRHVHSIAFAAFERRLVDQGETPHRTVTDFFMPVDATDPAVDRFGTWLTSRPDDLVGALERIVPTQTRGRVGLDDWSWVQALSEPSVDDPTHGWLHRATSEVREELGTLDELIDEAYETRNAGQAKRLEMVRNTVSRRELLGFLASRNVLPKYGFPVDVVELNLSGESEASRLELNRDLALAISDYAPGAQVVAAKRLWKSKGLMVRANQALPVYQWAICGDCGAYRQHLEEIAATCDVCGSDRKAAGKTGRFVVPVFGFVGGSAAKTGESRPPRMSVTETYFGSYRDEDPPLLPLEGFDRVRFRSSRQGRISIVNRGSRGRGFRICDWCGFGEPSPARPTRAGPAEHDDIRRPGRKCSGHLSHRHLGHEYLTDVTEIRFDVPMHDAAAVSTLYALLEGTPALSISREDVDGTQHRYSRHDPVAFILFDTVPGGAGHAQRIADNIPALLDAALRKVQSCECGPETACYNCLRSYSNQIFHDRLSRGEAERVLLDVTGAPARAPLTGDFSLLTDQAQPLIEDAVALGVPAPTVGCPVGPPENGWEVEAAWLGPKVAVLADALAERDEWLESASWDARPVARWTAASLSAAITT